MSDEDELKQYQRRYGNPPQVPEGFGDETVQPPAPVDYSTLPVPSPTRPTAPTFQQPAPPAQPQPQQRPAPAQGPFPGQGAPMGPATGGYPSVNPDHQTPQGTVNLPRGQHGHGGREDLSEEHGTIHGGASDVPKQGWQARAYRLGFRSVRKSEAELQYDAKISRIRKKMRRSKVVSVLAGKGGAGKTTTSINLSTTIAVNQRSANVAALSIDPRGNITWRIRQSTNQAPRSVMSLASDKQLITESDIRSYLVDTPEGLSVLGSSRADGAKVLTPDALDTAIEALRRVYGIVVMDFGNNSDSVTFHRGLEHTDQLVLVASTDADSVRELHALIADLSKYGNYVDLIHNAIIVFEQTHDGKPFIDVDAERSKFVNDMKKQGVLIPFDKHLSESGRINYDALDEVTKLRYVSLAADVMDKLPVD